MSEVDDEARRILRICQACMYCEGFCDTFPALGRLRELSGGDLDYLASLCHGCRDCHFACQYAPPHVFDVNVPRTLARLRQASYARHAWPRQLGAAFAANGRVVALVVAGVVALAATLLLVTGGTLCAAQHGEGAFYRVIPWGVMAGGAILVLGWSVLALALATRSYWRAIRPPAPWPEMLRALPAVIADIVTLRNLGGAGCRTAEDGAPQLRRMLHQTMVAGLGLCCVATAVAGFYGHVLGWQAPYPLASLPVLSGLTGGVLLAAGALGLLWIKRAADSAPLAPDAVGGEAAALALLAAVGLSGLAVLALRDTSAMALILVLHLGLVAGLFAVAPLSKIVHAPFRAAALLRAAIERRRTRV